MYRVEDKYVCSNLDLYLLQSRISTILKPDYNQHNKDGYTIISVYFDDIFDSYLQDTVDGNSFREKYRIRIYNHSFQTIKLEVKSKRYNRVKKKTKSITYDQMQLLLQGNSIPSDQTLDDPATLFNIAIAERKMCPKVIVAYERQAYIFEPGNVRITFDRNIRASSNVAHFGDKSLTYDIPKEYNSVLEVKYDEFLPDFISGLLETGNMQQVSYSKYRLCREVFTKGE